MTEMIWVPTTDSRGRRIVESVWVSRPTHDSITVAAVLDL